MNRPPVAETWLYRHDHVRIPRPYAFDVDEQDWLWEGTTDNRLLGHNLRDGELRVVEIPEMTGHVAYSVFCWHGKVLMTLGEAPFYLVYDAAAGQCDRKAIPCEAPIVWYGARLPGDRLMLFERRTSAAVILDAPGAAARTVPCPYVGDLASGSPHADGLVYIFLGDPARAARFDPSGEQFLDARPLPWPEAGVSGRFDHDGILYAADSAGGRILPLDMASQRWLDPIPHPDHGEVFGFIGGGFNVGRRGYFCLSTWAHRSRLDAATGKIVIPEGPLTVDGRPPRFMERMLIFDAGSREFDYLTAPPQPDGTPLLCYGWTDGERFAVTGTVLPHDESGHPVPEAGPWIILQSESVRGQSGT